MFLENVVYYVVNNLCEVDIVIDWFMNLTVENQIMIIVAVIAAGGGIIVAIINGIFNVFPAKKNNKTLKYSINQTAYDNGTQVGVQINNKKEDE